MGIQDTIMREMGAEECGAEMGPSIDLNLDVDEMRDSIMGSLQVANLDEDDASIFANQMACDLYMMLEKVADRYLRDEFKKMGLKYDDRIPTDEELDIMDQM